MKRSSRVVPTGDPNQTHRQPSKAPGNGLSFSGGIGCFLKKCYFCKMPIEARNACMYGDSHAFCSWRCAMLQMEKEDKDEERKMAASGAK